MFAREDLAICARCVAMSARSRALVKKRKGIAHCWLRSPLNRYKLFIFFTLIDGRLATGLQHEAAKAGRFLPDFLVVKV
jgi:hypothetical protein